ncbi:protein ANTAGONIST OF LIKE HETEROCHROMATIN PROTEIN 1 isoform X2 [Ixodes scapularis]|uniref:protein ANTAGONIST OF LIKE HETEROCHROMATIN PROTEIN 1 isoform X2 n=1 Tax=Ixodes scapularis TaxID=6945 RepID=UPI001AD71C14|nr:protein ANTAGONIST OF LIKE HETEROCHROMATIN PROTEIN 1 isoform X2 [Ixodes scapularis]
MKMCCSFWDCWLNGSAQQTLPCINTWRGDCRLPGSPSKLTDGNPKAYHFQKRGPYCQPRIKCLLLEYLNNETLDFREHFRITRSSFRNLLKTLWDDTDTKSHGWSHETELLIFLFWLGCGAVFKVVSACFNTPRTTTFSVVNRVLERIISKLDRMVYFPTSEDLREIKASFASLARDNKFRSCAGVVGSCHIQVQAPESMHMDYYCRKRASYSIQMQAVCDHRGVFLDVFAGYPGSVPCSRVLENSPLFVGALYPPQGSTLLGDSSYPCIDAPVAIATPYGAPRDAVQRHFNAVHARACCVVEQAFALMKGRWKSVFTKPLQVSIQKAPQVVAACAAMHNVCTCLGDFSLEAVVEQCSLQGDEADGEAVEETDEALEAVEDDAAGTAWRDEIAARLVCPPSELHDHNYRLTV